MFSTYNRMALGLPCLYHSGHGFETTLAGTIVGFSLATFSCLEVYGGQLLG